MPKLSDRYASFISFATLKEKDFIPNGIFFTAVFITYSVANAPPNIFYPAILGALQYLPKTVLNKLYAKYDSQLVVETILRHIVIPVKGFLFFIGFLILVYPILVSLWKSKSFWYELGAKRIGILAFGFSLILSLLVFPYAYPYGLNQHPSGLAGMGERYGRMSLAPFAQTFV